MAEATARDLDSLRDTLRNAQDLLAKGRGTEALAHLKTARTRLDPAARPYIDEAVRKLRLGIKEADEIGFWQDYVQERGVGFEQAGSMQPFFTDHFRLEAGFYADKRVLDIGCGPVGSLEWADMAAERVGLDPLADRYRELGTDHHAMDYVNGYSEDIPFADAHFDVVTSFNSIDHVDDLHRSAAEIVRVLKPGGSFLLATDIHDVPTVCEPVACDWDIVDLFRPDLLLVELKHLEKVDPERMHHSMMQEIRFDHGDPTRRYGILTARFVKPLRRPQTRIFT